MNRLVNFLKHQLDIDRPVLFGILSRIWSLVAGPVSFLLIATYFTPEIQGYYYTFSTLLALQIFIELGLGTVIQQFSSHEWAKLRLDADGAIRGDRDALSRLSSILRIGLKWFGFGGGIAALGLGISGYVFFATSPATGIHWTSPWVLLCLLTGLTIGLSPLWSVLEGCNQVARTYPFGFYRGVLTQCVGWVAIALGAQLWTAVATSLTSIVFMAYFLRTHYATFFRCLLRPPPPGPSIHWSRDMLPMQWRIAVSWISGYLSFSLFTPVLFKYHGPVVAGQMGMTWTLVGIVGSVAGAWLSPRVPRMAMYAAERNYRELDALFRRVTVRVLIAAGSVALAIMTFVWAINALDLPLTERLATRLLPPSTVFLFVLAQMVLVFSLPFSSYMRAHKEEPIMHLSVIAAIMIALSTLILGKYYSATGMAIGYLATQLTLIPLVIFIWYRRRQIWMSTT